MFSKKVLINATPREVVERLRDATGGRYFRDIVETGSNVQTNCPFHKGGQERKPSFGISDSGVCHCFTCGKSCSLSYLIWFILHVNGQKWLLENFSSYEINKRQPLDLDMYRCSNKPTVSDEPEFNFVPHSYLLKRNIPYDLAKKMEVSYNADMDSIEFTVRDFNGRYLGKVFRSVVEKRFFIPAGFAKPVVYADRFCGGRYSTCVVCESLFNALTCWRYGYPSVALLGTGSTEQYNILNKMNVRKFILALDNDDAGRRGREKLRESLKDRFLVTEWVLPDERDLNDLDYEIKNLKEIF